MYTYDLTLPHRPDYILTDSLWCMQSLIDHMLTHRPAIDLVVLIPTASIFVPRNVCASSTAPHSMRAFAPIPLCDWNGDLIDHDSSNAKLPNKSAF